MYAVITKLRKDSRVLFHRFRFTSPSDLLGIERITATEPSLLKLGLADIRDFHGMLTRIYLITYGQPRVGNFEYAMTHSELVSNSWRIVHKYDLVSTVRFNCSFCHSTVYGEESLAHSTNGDHFQQLS
ncbi:hypothetical protein COOONC_14155 [Cooperia oncophora]